MIALLLSLSLLQSGPSPQGTGPERVLERFLHAVTVRDSSTALSLLSGRAFGIVDSMAAADPVMLADLISRFGVEVDPATVGDTDPRALLGGVLTSDAFLGLMAMVEYEIGTAELDGSRALLPVAYSFMGNEGTITVELRREHGRWRLMDYYGETPL
ncbi:MAG TPA: hypothetical protein PLX54_08795 [Candidatus Fermentibacter daniensis]|nr:hypothetical protein [Candidatus Fermentibacter sp.]NLI02363.1 hypothetical protein [Candidatus Fermentibacter daniensis]OQC68258.1 MAG: hypothetical protein BWX47_01904 [candidate division Hyd24-12 bacterium ADurb.Bin004]MCC6871713.1 hypothetical protein [Candidatus Fermentibacter sp.]HOA05618.1 hypothetical protein [Candidatus Fermentibacter daniensis]